MRGGGDGDEDNKAVTRGKSMNDARGNALIAELIVRAEHRLGAERRGRNDTVDVKEELGEAAREVR